MGEAKRRKQLDSNYGKPLNEVSDSHFKKKASQWLAEAKRDLPKNFGLDYGHQYVATIGRREYCFVFECDYMVLRDGENYMVMARHGDRRQFCTSLIINQDQYNRVIKPYLGDPVKPTIQGRATPAILERYKTQSGEWVIPFQVIEIEANCIHS